MFDYLKRNIDTNHIRVTPYHAAIAERGGQTVHIDGSQGHAVGTVGDKGTPVQTVNIASLLNSLVDLSDGERRLAVVKLDVEGSEIAAVKGAEDVKDVDLLFVYEDWPRSGMPVSSFLLSEGYTVVGVHIDGRREELKSLHAAFDFNRRSASGYHPSNLVATRSPAIYPVAEL